MADSTRGLNLGHLLKSGQFSDLTLVCRDKEFNVHIAVVCSQSKVFAAAIREPCQTGKIVIEKYDTDTVEKMLEFLYTGDYKPQPHLAKGWNEPEEEDPMQHVLVNTIADYYDIKALADLSKEKLRLVLQNVENESLLLNAATLALSRTIDTTIRAMLWEATAKNIRHYLESGELEPLVGGFGIELLKGVVATDDELQLDARRPQSKLVAARKELRLVKAELVAARKELRSVKAERETADAWCTNCFTELQ